MKHLLTLAAFAALAAAAVATEITVRPNKPWKAAGNGEYTINFDGGKTWPSIDLKSQEIKPDKFYRLSFDAKASGAANTQTGITGMRGGKRSTDYTTWRAGADYAPFNLYFCTNALENPKIFFNINPGPAGDVAVRNLKLDEVANLGDNLLPNGDFENGNDFRPYSAKYEKTMSVVPSPSFFSGTKSLKLTKSANEGAEVISLAWLPAVPGKTIVVKFWAKSENGTIPGYMYLDFGRGGHKKHLYKPYNFNIEPEWKEIVLEYAVPTDTDTWTALKDGLCRLRVGLSKTAEAGAAFIDGVEYSIR